MTGFRWIAIVLAVAVSAAVAHAGSLVLDGRRGYAAGHCKALDLADAVTMEAWIKPGEFADSSARILDKDDNAYMLDTHPGRSLRMIAGNVPTRYAAKLPRGLWTHVVGVYDRKANVRSLYVNGKLVADTGRANMPAMHRNRHPLRVGCGTRTPRHRFRGEMDRVTIYNRALTAKEIAALADDAAHKSHALAGTVADWDFAKSEKGAYVSSAPGGIRLVPEPRRGGIGASPGPAAALTGQAPPPAGELTLWWRQPAPTWNDAMPIGNGRLGAMVFGGVLSERLQINEDTLWGGGPYDPTHDEALPVLGEVRRLIFAGDRSAAARLAGKMLAKPVRQMPYQPVGDVLLSFPGHETARDYRRELDMVSGVVRVGYSAGGVRFRREVFASEPGQVIAMRLTADKPGRIALTARMSSPQRASVRADGNDTLVLSGVGGPANGIEGAVRFQCRLKILATGGTTSVQDAELAVRDADAAVLLIAAGTSYRSCKLVDGDPNDRALRPLAAAARMGYQKLRDAHVADYRALFGRVAVDVGTTDAARRPTDERIRTFGEGKDPQLAAMYLQFGRYLLIASSRSGCQPANLQGIWNPHMKPPWESKHTININQQMNYWPAEMGNLAECHEPMLRMTTELVESGSRTARRHYNAPGWVCHHNTDLWRATAAIDGVRWGLWPTGGAWLCQHLWEHFLYGADRAYLRRVYPVMKGSAEFFLDTLVEHPETKCLVTCPSMSPEHGGLRAGPTMDMQILRDLFGNCIEASRTLGVDADLRRRLARARARLAPMRIGQHGQLQEWLEDDDNPNDHHRHVSHLYGLHPSNQITRQTPKLLAAARKSLQLRGDGGTGWSKAWKINFWARLGDGDHALRMFSELITKSTYPSLLDRCPPFVIDGNFGGASGLTEMLLQSHVSTRPSGEDVTGCGMDREIHLLPALPNAWPAGKVRGLRARGGFEVDFAWKAGRATEATVRSKLGRVCTVRYGERVVSFPTKPGGSYRLGGDLKPM